MMFASLKNKIREEIGSDVSTVVRNAGSIRGINSKHLSQTGSSSSISGSQISLNDSEECNTVSPSPTIQRQDSSSEFRLKDATQLAAKDLKGFEIRENEWRKRLIKQEVESQKRLDKKDEEWKIRLAEKEREWRKVLQKQEKEKLKLEESRQKIESAKQSLEVALQDAEEYKKKLYTFQEDAEQLEGYQTQEMAKIKHLLLAKEQEVDEKSCNLKAALAETDSLKTEVSRLRRYEDELNNIQDSSSEEISHLKSELEQSKTKLSIATTELDHIRLLFDDAKKNNSSLQLQLTRLRESLEIERKRYATLRVEYEKEQNEKDLVLLRNAQVSQKYEITKQEIRRRETENVDLNKRIEALEKSLEATRTENDELYKELENVSKRVKELEEAEQTRQKTEAILQTLKNNASNLEDQLSDRTKTIKVLQQRLADMKKTLQKELRIPSSSLHIDSEPSTAVLSSSSTKTITARSSGSQEEDVNFKYLKHVLIKFLTSREYEALHLTRAVATLLHFSPEEERLLQETLEWKMSWFGTKPNLGFGQTAKAIPPS